MARKLKSLQKLAEKAFKNILVSNNELIGKYVADEIKDSEGKIILESGNDINDEILEKIISLDLKSLRIVNIDPINKGPYLLETLKIDKNKNKNDSLNDIYKILRPGEAPTIEIAEEVFKNLYFNKERYYLSEVGRVKLNSKLDLKVSDKTTILTTNDIIEIIKFMLDLRDGKGTDDIDHPEIENRSVGELVENQFRIGLLRMERTVKKKCLLFRDRVRDASRFNKCKTYNNIIKDFLLLHNYHNLWIKLIRYLKLP